MPYIVTEKWLGVFREAKGGEGAAAVAGTGVRKIIWKALLDNLSVYLKADFLCHVICISDLKEVVKQHAIPSFNQELRKLLNHYRIFIIGLHYSYSADHRR